MIYPQDETKPVKCSPDALEFKTAMSEVLEQFLGNNPSENKKTVAAKVDGTQADLSHWISDQSPFTIPSHKLKLFCKVVGDNSLIWLLQEMYERVA